MAPPVAPYPAADERRAGEDSLEPIPVPRTDPVDPVLQADIPMLGKLWTDERDAKVKRMAALGLADDSSLQSAARFTELLEAEGIEVETKPG